MNARFRSQLMGWTVEQGNQYLGSIYPNRLSDGTITGYFVVYVGGEKRSADVATYEEALDFFARQQVAA